MEFPPILFLPTSGDSVLVIRTSKEASKKFLELHKLFSRPKLRPWQKLIFYFVNLTLLKSFIKDWPVG